MRRQWVADFAHVLSGEQRDRPGTRADSDTRPTTCPGANAGSRACAHSWSGDGLYA